MSAITMRAGDISRAISNASMILTRRSNIPILSCARMTVDGGTARVAATDMDMEIVTAFDLSADSDARGDVIIANVADLRRAIRATGANDVAYETGDEHATFVAGGIAVRHTIQFPSEDWPAWCVPGEPEWQATLGQDSLAILRRVFGAVSNEETRYYLNGIYVHADDLGLKAVATDGHRLYIGGIVAPDATGALAQGIIIPTKVLSALFRLADQNRKEPVVMSVRPMLKRNAAGDLAAPSNMAPLVEFTIGGTVMRSKLIDGTFPDYVKVIPQHVAHRATFQVGEFRRAVTCITAGVKARGNPAVKIEFKPGTAKLTCEWNIRESTAEAEVSVSHDVPEGAVPLGINGRYLLEAINAIGAESTITMAFAEAPQPEIKKAGAFSGGGWAMPVSLHSPDDATFKAVVMPMRV